jgi:hypothetical protein
MPLAVATASGTGTSVLLGGLWPAPGAVAIPKAAAMQLLVPPLIIFVAAGITVW